MAESSQSLRVRHEGTEMTCAARRGKQNSHVSAPSSELRICDQLRRKCRCPTVQTGKDAACEGSDLSKAKGSDVEWTTVQLSVTKVSKWPGRANERFRRMTGNLPFAGTPRQDFRACRDGRLVAGSVRPT